MSEPPRRISSSDKLTIKRVDREAPTLVPCPACDGDGMVTIERKGFVLERLAEPVGDEHLVTLDDPGEKQ